MFGGSPRTRRRVAPGRHGLARLSADLAEAGCVACDDGDGVKKKSVHCAIVGWTHSADHCR